MPTILGELRRHFRDATWFVRPPRNLMELALSVEREREPLRTRIGREPTVEDLAARLDRTPEHIADAVVAAGSRWAGSLDTAAGEAGSETTVTDRFGGDDDGYTHVEAKATLELLLAVVDQRARDTPSCASVTSCCSGRSQIASGCRRCRCRASLDARSPHSAFTPPRRSALARRLSRGAIALGR